MGRPIKKIFFGNTGTPPIGGEGIASFTVGGTNNNYTSIPTITSIGAPDLPGGVQAVGTIATMVGKTATVATSGTGATNADYAPADVLTLVGGTGTASTFTVSTIKVRTVGVAAAGTGYAVGDTITFSTGNTSNAVLTVSNVAAVSATIATSGTGTVAEDYDIGDTLTLVGGTGTAAEFTVDTVKVRTIAVQAAGTNTWSTGDTVTFSTGWTTPAVITITDDGAGGIASLTITNAGVRNTAIPADPVAPDSTTNISGLVNGATFNIGFGVESASVSVAGDYTVVPANPVSTTTDSATGTGATLTVAYGVLGTTISSAGSRATAGPADPVTPDATSGGGSAATFNLGWGVNTVAIGTAGSYTVLPANPVSTTTNSVSGTGATLTVNYGIGTATVSTAGSGYLSAPAVTLSGGNGTLTSVLTSTNPDAFAVTAFVVGGSSAIASDIVKQEASRRYLVQNLQGISDCSLVAAPPLAGEMTLLATDSAGGTYYPIKVTQSKATIVKGGRTGTQFDTHSFEISAISRADGLVSVTTATPHDFGDGAQIYIFGVTGATDTFNGVFNINVTSTTTFEYFQNGANESGTVSANSNASAGTQVDWVIAPETAVAGVSVVIATTP